MNGDIYLCAMPHLPDATGGNPWTTLTSEDVYESPWIRVRRHDVLNPNGNPGTYSVVHFKNIAIGIVVLDEEHNTWLVGQYRYPLESYTWEIPEGGGHPAIDPLESAKRELLEETGITAARWTKIQEMHLSNSATDEFCVLFLAQELTFGEAEPEDTEELRLLKLPFADAYQMVCDGQLTDSLTVTGILKVKLLLTEGKR